MRNKYINIKTKCPPKRQNCDRIFINNLYIYKKKNTYTQTYILDLHVQNWPINSDQTDPFNFFLIFLIL